MIAIVIALHLGLTDLSSDRSATAMSVPPSKPVEGPVRKCELGNGKLEKVSIRLKIFAYVTPSIIDPDICSDATIRFERSQDRSTFYEKINAMERRGKYEQVFDLVLDGEIILDSEGKERLKIWRVYRWEKVREKR